LVRTVFVTVPDGDTGISLARTVVGEGLAACGNVVPGLTSVYRWKGRVEVETEALIIFKTTARGLEALKKRVVELHPYDVPEFLALEIKDGHLPYLQWVMSEVDDGGRS
jgi:periplasmic divalent cation tolerance protein